MKAETIGKFRVGYDYSGNYTVGTVINTQTGECDQQNVVDSTMESDEYTTAQATWAAGGAKNAERLAYLVENGYPLMSTEQKAEYDAI